MITLDDCIGFSGLPKEAVFAIAQHEHLPDIAAAGLASTLVVEPDGCRLLGGMIADEIFRASRRGKQAEVAALRHALEVFVKQYPEAQASVRVCRVLKAAG